MTVSNYVLDPVSHWAKYQRNKLAARIFIVAPLSIITRAIDTIVAIGAILASIATLGQFMKINELADDNVNSAAKILTIPYKYVLNAINPEWKRSNNALIQMHGDGLTHIAASKIWSLAYDCTESKNKLTKYVLSRALFALCAVVSTITCLADLVIGVVAGIFSILALGRFNTLNYIALRGLEGSVVIMIPFIAICKAVNPFPKEPPRPIF